MGAYPLAVCRRCDYHALNARNILGNNARAVLNGEGHINSHVANTSCGVDIRREHCAWIIKLSLCDLCKSVQSTCNLTDIKRPCT